MTGDSGRPSVLAIWLDLLLTVGFALITVAPVVFLGDVSALGPAQVPLGFLLVFFLPGYAVVAAFYPSPCFGNTASRTTGLERSDAPNQPSALERVVLAIGLSVMMVPLVVLIWNFTPWGIAAPQVLASLAVMICFAAVVGAYRRAKRPAADRFHLPLAQLSFNRSTLAGEDSREATATVAVTILVVISVLAVSLAVAVPENGERYTELYLMNDESDSGALLSDDGPPTLQPGESQEIHVGIGNRESREITYTVVIVLQRIETIGDDRRVVNEAELDRFTATLEAGEQIQRARDIVADEGVTGENVRLAFLLYKETPPPEPSVTNAYREVHIWISVPTE